MTAPIVVNPHLTTVVSVDSTRVGPRGLPGANGTDGTNGTNGTNGADGAPGDWTTPQTVSRVSGASHTVSASDVGKLVIFSSPSAVTVTVDSSTALTEGQRVDFLAAGVGVVTFVFTGVTYLSTPSLVLRAQGSGATLVCTGTNDYWLTGDLANA